MAEGGLEDIGTVSFTGLLDKLMAMTLPVPNDKRQDQNCNYINMLVSAFGKEYCLVVGSTKEGTRLRSRQDEGDYDYILLGNLIVPTECLEYREDLPCFVHIKGSFMGEKFCDQLIDGVYLPTWLLKDVSSLAFPRLKGIFDMVSRSNTSHDRHTPHLAMNSSSKAGYNLVNYADWNCEALTVKKNVRSASERSLLNQFEKRREDSQALQGDTNNVVSSFAAVVDFAQNMKSKDTSTGLVYQQLGPMLCALAGKMSGMSNKRQTEEDLDDDRVNTFDSTPLPDASNNATNSTGKKARIQTSENEAADLDAKTEQMDTSSTNQTNDQNRESITVNKNTISNQMNKGESINITIDEENDPDVYATFGSKSEKDFIPALRLSEPPKFIEEWKQRTGLGYWPRPQVVEVISRSQFFVVAKPAVKDEKPDMDFCLSCNLAEIILAKETPPGHKKCLLMVKAFQRSILEEYSKVLTTFHWKTALYRLLESTDPVTYLESSEGVLNVLRSLLDYMRDRLHEGNLQHYFFPSNLFAGLETCVRAEIAKKLEEIYNDPIWHLRSFFCLEKERVSKPRVVKIPASAIAKVKSDVEDKRDELSVDAFANALEGFAQPSSTEVPVQNLLLQILETALTDEEDRRKEKETKNPGKANPPTVTKHDLVDSLKGLISKLGADEKDRRQAEKEAKEKALSYFKK
ncbi:uncharacterized protein LOC110446015 [Mizuhopecten yessoensis]|uniref:uncharacterized protein LOC110446015 n=1 Tax=Mizuhopecten yessoensis TaxID=6573 RepID=UPI000B45DBC6|nr:uncharacterized protein LOC110446015 [Mizuhopecten yessoensis]